MSRKNTVIRDIGVDYKFKSTEVQSLINKIMYDGKKTLAQNIVYEAMDLIGENALETLKKALVNLSPNSEVRYKKVGGSTYAVPRRPRTSRRAFLAIKWLIEEARSTKANQISLGLNQAIVNAANNTGKGIESKLQLEKLADNSRAYSGLNW